MELQQHHTPLAASISTLYTLLRIYCTVLCCIELSLSFEGPEESLSRGVFFTTSLLSLTLPGLLAAAFATLISPTSSRGGQLGAGLCSALLRTITRTKRTTTTTTTRTRTRTANIASINRLLHLACQLFEAINKATTVTSSQESSQVQRVKTYCGRASLCTDIQPASVPFSFLLFLQLESSRLSSLIFSLLHCLYSFDLACSTSLLLLFSTTSCLVSCHCFTSTRQTFTTACDY